jgi:hypothetical protein
MPTPGNSIDVEFHEEVSKRLLEVAGYIDAIRLMIAALVKTHPDKAALVEACRAIDSVRPDQIAILDPSRQAALDEAYSQFISHAAQQR